MKKLIIATACALAVTGSAFAQGAVNWGAISFTSMTAQTNSTVFSPLFGGGATGGGTVGNAGGNAANAYNGGYYYELLVGAVWNGSAQASPATVGALSSWTDSGLAATNSGNAGRLQVLNANTAATVNSMSSSVSNSIMMVGWSANLGTTWAAALASLNAPGNIVGQGFFGVSTVGFIEAAALPAAQGNNVFGAAQTYGTPIISLNTQLDLVPTPEPGTLALAALGGASLLLFRRKK